MEDGGSSRLNCEYPPPYNVMKNINDEGSLEEKLRRLRKKTEKTSYETSSPTKEESKVKIQADLNKIISAYNLLLSDEELNSQDAYNSARKLITDREMIYKFVNFLSEYDKSSEKLDLVKFHRNRMAAGYFISGLINNLKEGEDVILDLTKYPGISGIGYSLSKHNLFLKGDVDESLGSFMMSGRITLEGNAQVKAGSMDGGEIIIKGNGGDVVGQFMKGGKITVEEAGDEVGSYMYSGEIVVNINAGKNVGSHMKGGEIHLNGNYESISKKIKGGEVYHKGKRIFP